MMQHVQSDGKRKTKVLQKELITATSHGNLGGTNLLSNAMNKF